MAFVIVMHLSPDYESRLDQVLQRATAMHVLQVAATTSILPNCVYLISPALNLKMAGTTLEVSPADPHDGRPQAIDLFFRSLAEEHGGRAISIVLSGAGSDGTLGIGRIKEAAGVTIAQSLDDAECAEMPRSAIASGMIDIVLPVAEIAGKLIELWNNARNIDFPDALQGPQQDTEPKSNIVIAEQALSDILNTVRVRTGHDFRHYKRATILRRIERRLKINALTDLHAYSQFLAARPEETVALLQDLLIGVTNFFRDRDGFDVVRREVLPSILSERIDREAIRAWSVGCSTGEEAYSLAMLLFDMVGSEASAPKIQLFATDIDERAIQVGRLGAYAEGIHTDVSADRIKKFFVKTRGRYLVTKSLRDSILFAHHNILSDPPFSRIDVITCRNLLIYLDRSVQRQVLQTFYFSLRPGGFLFLGTAETADMADDLFVPFDKKNRIYRAKILPPQQRSKTFVPIAARLGTTSIFKPSVPQKVSTGTYMGIQQRALNHHVPPHVIVDREGQILHQSEHAAKYLRFTIGEPTYDFFALLIPELRLDVRTAFFQAVHESENVDVDDIRITREDGDRLLDVAIRPFHDETECADVVLVTFRERRPSKRHSFGFRDDSSANLRVEELERELAHAKAQLILRIEHASTSTEELKASNEELQAIVEEMRSTSEELETGKEELQSVNEELTTVNVELHAKVEETAKANDDLENLLAGTGIITIFLDRRMHIKRFSASAVTLFNLIDSDIGRPLPHLTHQLDYPNLAQDAGLAFGKLTPIEREVTAAGNRWFLARMLPYRTADDHIDGVVITFIDVTARRAAEAEARDKDDRLKLAALATNDYAIIVQDEDGTIVNWNRGAERVFGYSEGEAVGRSIDLIFTEHDLANGISLAEREQAKSVGRADDERWHLRKDGVEIYCSGVVTLIDTDIFKGFAKIARDATDKKGVENQQQLQLTLERAVREQAEESNRLKDEFFAVLSHELKNPLNLIHVKAELLTRIPAAREIPHVQDAADAIQRSVIAQAKIIDDLLDLSRVRTGKLALRIEEIDLAEVIQTVCTASMEDAKSAGIQLVCIGVDEPFYVRVDAVRFEQIVWNLVRNALKFTSRGGSIEIKLKADGDVAHIEVVDTGRGISAEFLPRLFDMFSQAEGGGRRDRGGLGIGLSLVKQLAELHGGTIGARSAGVGLGASFTLRLPRGFEQASGGRELKLLDPSVIRGLSILLVDDALDSLEAFRTILEIEGAVVLAVPSGEKALEAIETNRFDLILSDIGMPTMDGYEFIRRVRVLPSAQSVPAIALTGFGREQDAAKAISAGFSGHVGKPVSLDALLDEVDRCYKRSDLANE